MQQNSFCFRLANLRCASFPPDGMRWQLAKREAELAKREAELAKREKLALTRVKKAKEQLEKDIEKDIEDDDKAKPPKLKARLEALAVLHESGDLDDAEFIEKANPLKGKGDGEETKKPGLKKRLKALAMLHEAGA